MARAAWRSPRRVPSMLLHRAADTALAGYPAPLAMRPEFAASVEAYVAHARSFEPADAYYLSNHRGHLMFVRPDERPFITAEMIRRTSFIGTAARPDAAHRRAGRCRLHAGGVLDPARAGARDRGLGTHPPGLPLTAETSYRRHAMPGPLADKTAFVTAAGQGIGRATALAFAAAGARVIATDIDAAKVQAIASDSIRTARLDVLRADDIAQAARDAGADRHPVQLCRLRAPGHVAGGDRGRVGRWRST